MEFTSVKPDQSIKQIRYPRLDRKALQPAFDFGPSTRMAGTWCTRRLHPGQKWTKMKKPDKDQNQLYTRAHHEPSNIPQQTNKPVFRRPAKLEAFLPEVSVNLSDLHQYLLSLIK